jgi:hypothetical protein
MNIEETTHYIQDSLVGFLCRGEPAGDFRTSKKLFLPEFSHEYNAQKRASLVWGSYGEVPSKEVSPYITFLDKEEPGVTAGLINSDEKIAYSAQRILLTIAFHEQSPPTARRLLTELAFARASLISARYSLSEAKTLDCELEEILTNLLDAYDFENPESKGEHPALPLRKWAQWYENSGETGLEQRSCHQNRRTELRDMVVSSTLTRQKTSERRLRDRCSSRKPRLIAKSKALRRWRMKSNSRLGWVSAGNVRGVSSRHVELKGNVRVNVVPSSITLSTVI